jgi:hypothetical protein
MTGASNFKLRKVVAQFSIGRWSPVAAKSKVHFDDPADHHRARGADV